MARMVAPATLHSAAVPRVQSGLDVLVHRRLGAPARPALRRCSPTRRRSTRGSITPSTCCATCAGRASPRCSRRSTGCGAPLRITRPIAAERDPVTGLRVVSLYGERREPTPAMLRGLDAAGDRPAGRRLPLLHVQWTMALAHARVRARRRPGARARPAEPARRRARRGQRPRSGVRLVRRPLPAAGPSRAHHRRGRALPAARARARLRSSTVVADAGLATARCSGRTPACRGCAPSPNMPTPDTARVYPGGCLIEGTNLSEGRGTTRPFEWVGAPWLDAHAYADGADAPSGCRASSFRPARFRPTFQKWAGQRVRRRPDPRDGSRRASSRS